VAFGGIAGLCLGFSLLSGAELFYYLTVGLYRHYRLVYRARAPEHEYSISNNKTSSVIEQHRNHLQSVRPGSLQVRSPWWLSRILEML